MIFDPRSGAAARVFALPPGVDYATELVKGLRRRLPAAADPSLMGQVRLIVSTDYMRRRLGQIFEAAPAGFMPKIHLLSGIHTLDLTLDVAPPIPYERRRFELMALVAELLKHQPELAPRAALFDLADALANLLDEMSSENVSPRAIETLDVSDQSGHWQRAQQFFAIANRFIGAASIAPDRETHHRQVIEQLVDKWAHAAPDYPIILGETTGSRRSSLLLLQRVARLPQGAVVLPGFDFDTPADIWARLADSSQNEGHPQFRLARLMKALGLAPKDIEPWSPTPPPSAARNRLISLALRPAPFTDQWLREGGTLRHVKESTARMTLVEAPSARLEALTIALGIRQAMEDHKQVALITPDWGLKRQVAAALERWGIVPDDPAGIPLQQTPPGRLLRQVADLFIREPNTVALLALLKHPSTHASTAQAQHRRLTRRLEVALRKEGIVYPTPAWLTRWASAIGDAAPSWVCWVCEAFFGQVQREVRPFAAQVQAHITLATGIATAAQGTTDTALESLEGGSGSLWQHAAGRKAAELMARLRDTAASAPPMTAHEYAQVFEALLSRPLVREPEAKTHRGVFLWSPREARIQSVDIMILGGLNEGSWPAHSTLDPWLNRTMRQKAGLLSAERRIGLSAHDFQQAVAAPQVWLTRAVRTGEAEAISARWLNRLTNLLDGLPACHGPQALAAMRARGNAWLLCAQSLDAASQDTQRSPAPRPAPRPPAAVRPRALPITDIKQLIIDPYTIYARHVLKLRPLPPLKPVPDALLRGTLIHKALHGFIPETVDDPSCLTAPRLITSMRQIFDKGASWAMVRLLWRARIERIAQAFVQAETQRQERATPIAFERRGTATLAALDFTLTATADRIDRQADGQLILYDYKSGAPPSQKKQEQFDKQLLLEAAMAEQGAFNDIAAAPVALAAYIGLNNPPTEVAAPLDKIPTEQIWQELTQVIRHYQNPDTGFVSHGDLYPNDPFNDYDHLARFGEWDASTPPTLQDLA